MLEEENVTLKRKLKSIEKNQEKTRKKVDQIENRLLEGNVIMYGIEEGNDETSMQLYDKVIDAISYTVTRHNKKERLEAVKAISVSMVKRVERKNPSRKRPVVISFVYKVDAINLLEQKRKLPQGVYVDKEYPEDVEERRKYLRPILRAARQNPKYKGLCRMEDDVLVINSTCYTRENLHKLPKNIDKYHAMSKRNKEVVGFFEELNPFSNFHDVMIEIDGIKFHSSEQWIQYQKAKLFGDTEIEERILKSTKAIDCKRLAYKIEDYNEEDWKENIKRLCYRGLKAKFTQLEWLSRLLLETDQKCIVECTPNTIWENGVPLKDKDALNKSKWNGIGETGLMGSMLMKIREEIKEGEDLEVKTDDEYEADTEPEEIMEVTATAEEDTADDNQES